MHAIWDITPSTLSSHDWNKPSNTQTTPTQGHLAILWRVPRSLDCIYYIAILFCALWPTLNWWCTMWHSTKNNISQTKQYCILVISKVVHNSMEYCNSCYDFLLKSLDGERPTSLSKGDIKLLKNVPDLLSTRSDTLIVYRKIEKSSDNSHLINHYMPRRAWASYGKSAYPELFWYSSILVRQLAMSCCAVACGWNTGIHTIVSSKKGQQYISPQCTHLHSVACVLLIHVILTGLRRFQRLIQSNSI